MIGLFPISFGPAGTGHWWTDYPNNKEGNYIYYRENGIAYVGSPNTQTLIDGWIYAYRLTKDKKYYDYARIAFDYYLNYPDISPYYGGQAAAKLTGYYYRIIVFDGFGNSTASTDHTFTTTTSDTTAPIISSLRLFNPLPNSAEIRWETNEPATSEVEYGLTTSYGDSTPLNASLITNHSVTLTGLTLSTLYHYRVRSKDSLGNEEVSADATFTTTADIYPPVISNVNAPTVGENMAIVAWKTNEDATSQVEYWIQGESHLFTPKDTSLVSDHSVVLSGLSASTTYAYQVISSDAADNQATSTEQSFTTTARGTGTSMSFQNKRLPSSAYTGCEDATISADYYSMVCSWPSQALLEQPPRSRTQPILATRTPATTIIRILIRPQSISFYWLMPPLSRRCEM